MLEDDIQKSFNDFINYCSTVPKEVMLRTLRQAHPALQEKFADLVFKWIADYGANYNVDDRNRRTVNKSRRIVEAYKRKYGYDL